MKRIFILTAFNFLYSAASAQDIDVFSCDTCSYEQLLEIAKKEAPPVRCAGDTAKPNPNDCSALAKTLIVANPLTGKAKKLRVRARYNASTLVYEQAISAEYASLLSDWYDLDKSVRQAVLTLDTYPLGLAQREPGLASDHCDQHPINYLLNENYRSALSRQMTQDVIAQLGSSRWGDKFSDIDISGVGLSLGRGSASINISVTHNKNNVYTSASYGNWDYNRLVFRVEPRGSYDYNGQRTLALSFTLQRETSLLDGKSVNALFGDGVMVNLAQIGGISTCLLNKLSAYGQPINDFDIDNPGMPIVPRINDEPGGRRSCLEPITVYTRIFGTNRWDEWYYLVPKEC